MNIFEIIKNESKGRDLEQIALKDGHNRLSYAALFSRVDGVASALSDQGVGSGKRVALFCSDSIDYVIGSLAILSLYAVVIPVAATSAEHEVEELLERIQIDFLFFDRALYGREGKALTDALFLEKELCLIAFDEEPPSASFLRLSPAFVRFSSGTTGQSKGVLLSHEAIVERTDAADRGLEITEADTVLWVLSMSFHFVVSILLFLRRGATICLCYDHFPLALQDAVQRGEGTFIYAAPFHYFTLCSSDAFAANSLKKVRMAISTAMKLPDETAEAFANKFGFELTEAYGIIEVGLPFLNRSPRKARGAVGKMLPDYELELRDADTDGIGEICIRGKGMFSAYMSPWKTFERGDWFNAGDLGRLDEEGNLYIVGRTKNLINFMGMKVFPYEVEAVLNAHPSVAEALVYGAPHPRYGQLPCARVVLREKVSEMDLRRYCLTELSPYKAPKRFVFVDELAKTPSGKLIRDLSVLL